jgi:hypothetical protein
MRPPSIAITTFTTTLAFMIIETIGQVVPDDEPPGFTVPPPSSC